MNIFPIAQNGCPIQSAKELCNKHSSRMPLETAGMISFAFPEGETSIKNQRTNRHYNHPASAWVRASKLNLEWTILHGLAQCEEYTRRYKRIHSSQNFIEWADYNKKYLIFEFTQQTPFARCFSQYKETLDAEFSDTVIAYRAFYWLDKKEFARWPSIDSIPDWWTESSVIYVDKYFVDGNYIKR